MTERNTTRETPGETAYRLALEDDARKLAENIKKKLPPHVGFVLITYDYGKGGAMTFISTGNREDTIKMLREMVNKIRNEGAGAPIPIKRDDRR